MLAVLGVASLLQLVIVAKGYLLPWGERIWEIRDDQAWRRAGILTVGFGPHSTEFAAFLRDRIPEQAVVVIPTDTAARELRFPHLWQYYLFPRSVLGCPNEEFHGCISGQDLHSTYIVRVGKVPSQSSIPVGFAYAAFDDALGVYIPGDSAK